MSILKNLKYAHVGLKIGEQQMLKLENPLMCLLSSLMLAVIAPTFVSANCCGDPCSYNCCNIPYCADDYMLGIDFLWWKPCVEDISFGGTLKNTESAGLNEIDFDYEGICPDWSSGVRLTFDYPNLFTWCNIGMTASYTYFEMNQKHTIHGSDNIFFLFHPGLGYLSVDENPIHGKWYMKYQDWDTMFYFNNSCCECVNITPSIGVAGILLNQDLKAHTCDNNDVSTLNWKSNLIGVGLKLGLELDYCYCNCLKFYGFADGAVLAAHSHTKNKQSYVPGNEEGTTTKLKMNDHNCCSCIPGFHLGAGVETTVCVCGFPVSFRAGYEFLEWFNLPKHRVFTTESLGAEIAQSASTTRSICFHGPFAGIILSF